MRDIDVLKHECGGATNVQARMQQSYECPKDECAEARMWRSHDCQGGCVDETIRLLTNKLNRISSICVVYIYLTNCYNF